MRLDEFLLARIAEDEKVARALLEPYAWGWSTFWEASPKELEHINRHDPTRVLADCAAKRAIIELHGPLSIQEPGIPTAQLIVCKSCGDQGVAEMHVLFPCPTLQLLAGPDTPTST